MCEILAGLILTAPLRLMECGKKAIKRCWLDKGSILLRVQFVKSMFYFSTLAMCL